MSCSDERAEGSLAELIANLSSLLVGHAGAPGELPSPHYSCLLSEPPLYAFSDGLLYMLLTDSPIDIPSPEELLSLISQNLDKISLSLETVSLQCLAAYLLKRSTDDCLALGLHLLMVCFLVQSTTFLFSLTRFIQDEPQYITNSHSLQPQLNFPESETHLPLAHKIIIEESYKIFTSGTRHLCARRMVCLESREIKPI